MSEEISDRRWKMTDERLTVLCGTIQRTICSHLYPQPLNGPYVRMNGPSATDGSGH